MLRNASPTSSPNKCAELRHFDRDRSVDCDIAQRIEELDRQLEFLVEKLAHVRRARAAAAKKNALGAALLLRAIMTDRAHQFRVQSRHRAADDLRDARHIRIGGFRIGATQTNESVALLAKFRRANRLAKFLRDRGGDRAAANRNAAAENFPGSMKSRLVVRAPMSTSKRAIGQLAVVVTKGVVERHRRDIHQHRLQAGCLDRGVDPFEQVGLDRDQHDLDVVRSRCPTSW